MPAALSPPVQGAAIPRGALAAVRAQFFGAGFLFATWGVHIPTVRVRYGIDEGGIGLALLAMGMGAIAGLLRAGPLIARHGPAGVLRACGPVLAAALALLLVMPGYGALLALLVGFGFCNSVFDVAVNAEGAELERRAGRPLMSGLHGMFSAGGMAGAALGSLLVRWPEPHLAGVALAMAVLVLAAARWMLRTPPAAAGDAGHRFVLPRGVLLLLGTMAALGLIAEGAMYDWSVLYLQQEVGAPQSRAALAYACFSAAMAATRFTGDALRARLRPALLVAASALLAACAMLLTLNTHNAALALVGCALVGVGFANVVPVLFAAAGQVPGVAAAQGIAAVASMGYLGFMAGPPVIGLLAHRYSLTAALYLVVVFALLLAAGSVAALRGRK